MRDSAGFTLVELLVALTVAGLVLAAAHQLFRGVVDGVLLIERAQNDLNREANARRLLATVVRGIEVNRTIGAFAGDERRVEFTAWDADSVGLAVRRRIVLTSGQGALTLTGIGPEPVRLLERVDELALDYLLQFGAEQRFVRQWHSDAAAPAALRVRVTRGATADTLLLPVGRRG